MSGPRSAERPGPGKHLLELYLSYACDARCAYCYSPDGGDSLPFAEAARALYAARRRGYERLSLIGGEPTVYGDIVKVCALAKRLGFRSIGLYTNGMRLADPALARGLSEAGLDTAFVALRGHAPRWHDAIAGVGGSFRKVLKGLENLRREGIRIKLVCVLDARNHDRLPEFCEFFIDLLGAPEIRVLRVFYAPQGRFMPAADAEVRGLMVTMSKAAPFILKAVALFKKKGLEPPTLNHFTPCVFPGNEQGVLERLHCLMEEDCAERVLSYSPAGFKPISSPGLEEIKPAKCRPCAYFAACPGVEKGYLDLFGDGELRPLARRPS